MNNSYCCGAPILHGICSKCKEHAEGEYDNDAIPVSTLPFETDYDSKLDMWTATNPDCNCSAVGRTKHEAIRFLIDLMTVAIKDANR